MKNFKKKKTIEFFYKKDGRLQKQNEYDYNDNKIIMNSYWYEQINDNQYRQYDESNNTTGYLEYDNMNNISIKICFVDAKYTQKCLFNDSNNILYKEHLDKKEKYYYLKNGDIDYIIVEKENKTEKYYAKYFSNSIIFENDKGIYRIETYDDNENLVTYSEESIYIHRDYNKKGLITKSNIYYKK